MDKDDVQDIGEPSIKALCTENDFMVASAEGCGYFTDKDNSLVEMFKTLLRESQRLKVATMTPTSTNRSLLNGMSINANTMQPKPMKQPSEMLKLKHGRESLIPMRRQNLR